MPATEKALDRAGLTLGDVEVIELSDADGTNVDFNKGTLEGWTIKGNMSFGNWRSLRWDALYF